jgi:hypothetical protein
MFFSFINSAPFSEYAACGVKRGLIGNVAAEEAEFRGEHSPEGYHARPKASMRWRRGQ